MRAAVYDRFGGPSVVTVQTLDTPVPGPGEVLVRVAASIVSTSDVAMRSGKPFAARLFAGPFRPRLRILGSEFTGTVAAVGEGVERFTIGDAVWGVTGTGHARPRRVHRREGGRDRRAAPRRSRPDRSRGPHRRRPPCRSSTTRPSSSRVSRSSSTARPEPWAPPRFSSPLHRGATVTAVCSAERAPLVRELGAHEVLDYRAGDVVARLRAQGRTFDVVFDVHGDLGYRERARPADPDGPLLRHGADDARSSGTRFSRGARPAAAGSSPSRGCGGRMPSAPTCARPAALAESGVLKPVVGTRYPLERVADAHAHVERGKAGQIVLTMA